MSQSTTWQGEHLGNVFSTCWIGFHHAILNMAKAWQRYSNRHGRYITRAWWTARRPRGLCWGGCSAPLPSWHSQSCAEVGAAPRTALPMRGGSAEETEGPMPGHCVVTVRLLSLRASRPNLAAHGVRVKRVPWRTHGDALHSIASTLRPHSPPLHPQNQPSAE